MFDFNQRKATCIPLILIELRYLPQIAIKTDIYSYNLINLL